MRLGERSGEVIVGEPEGEEAISPRLATALVEMIINEAAVVDRLPNQHEVKNKFIYDLLHSRIDDEEQILSQARFLGMDLAPPRAVILIDASAHLLPPADPARGLGTEGDTRVQRQAQFIIGSVVSFFHLPNDTICAYIGDGEVAVLKASNTKNLAGWVEGKRLEELNNSWANLAALKRAGDALLARLRSDTGASISIGIGRYHPGSARPGLLLPGCARGAATGQPFSWAETASTASTSWAWPASSVWRTKRPKPSWLPAC